MMENSAWLILRVVYALMFFYPIYGLLKDWSGTKNMTALLFPCAVPLFAVLMMLTMFFGAFSILFGIWGQLAGFALLIYCLLGAVVHFRLARHAQKIHLSIEASHDDQQQLKQVIQLATVGNVTSAQKNFVLAAVACFFMLMGTGPFSLWVL